MTRQYLDPRLNCPDVGLRTYLLGLAIIGLCGILGGITTCFIALM